MAWLWPRYFIYQGVLCQNQGNPSLKKYFLLLLGGHLFTVVERQGYSAVLIDQGGVDKLRREALAFGRCNRSQCTAGVIGGAINGGLMGAGGGAAVGLYFGPKGALAGFVIGASAGSVGGALEDYGSLEACNCPSVASGRTDRTATPAQLRGRLCWILLGRVISSIGRYLGIHRSGCEDEVHGWRSWGWECDDAVPGGECG